MGEIDVVLVEDDALVRACLTEMLSDGGLRVAEAPSAAEALEAADAAGPSAVLVTDLYLGPGMDGTALIAALRERQPSMRAVLISGGEVADGKLDPRDAFLSKPFHGEDLVRAIEGLRADAAGH
jgi:CheY-like chemotaxis protein